LRSTRTGTKRFRPDDVSTALNATLLEAKVEQLWKHYRPCENSRGMITRLFWDWPAFAELKCGVGRAEGFYVNKSHWIFRGLRSDACSNDRAITE
jgi:hypothetical protein